MNEMKLVTKKVEQISYKTVQSSCDVAGRVLPLKGGNQIDFPIIKLE